MTHPDAKEKVAFRHLACSKRARRSDRLLTKYFSVKLVVIQFLTVPMQAKLYNTSKYI